MNEYILFYYINKFARVPVFLTSNIEFDLSKINPMLSSKDETLRKMALKYIKFETNNKLYETYYSKFKMELIKDN